MALFRSRIAPSARLARTFSTSPRVCRTSNAPFTAHEAGGVKVVTRDHQSPTSLLSVVINKAGSRYDDTVGASHALQRFAFQDTEKKSGLRLVRETELLGGQLSSIHTRESIILSAKFFREDLPYFVEALSSVITCPLLQEHEFKEKISKLLKLDYHQATKNPLFLALEAAHEAAFRKGLGNSLLAIPETPISLDKLHEFAATVYVKPNITIAGQDVDSVALQELVDEHLRDLPTPAFSPSSTPTSVYHGEARVRSPHGDAIVIAFPTVGIPHHHVSSLAHALGGQSSIKWTQGSSPLGKISTPTGQAAAYYHPYSDAGLLYISISGQSTSQVSELAQSAANIIKSIGDLKQDDIKRGITQAKFDYLSVEGIPALQAAASGVLNPTKLPETSVDDVLSAGKKILESKPVLAAVGNVHKLPYSDELGF